MYNTIRLLALFRHERSKAMLLPRNALVDLRYGEWALEIRLSPIVDRLRLQRRRCDLTA